MSTGMFEMDEGEVEALAKGLKAMEEALVGAREPYTDAIRWGMGDDHLRSVTGAFLVEWEHVRLKLEEWADATHTWMRDYVAKFAGIDDTLRTVVQTSQNGPTPQMD